MEPPSSIDWMWSVPPFVEVSTAVSLNFLPVFWTFTGAVNFAQAVTFNQPVTFSSSQPVGTGTITGVTAGTGLTGGGPSGVVTLNLDTSQVATLSAPNDAFAGNLSAATGTFSGGASPVEGLQNSMPRRRKMHR